MQKNFKGDVHAVARHVVSNCIAWKNKNSGVYANHQIAGFDEAGKGYGGIDFEYNTSAKNGMFNYNLASRRQLADVDRTLTDPVTGRSLIDFDGENYRLTNNVSYGDAAHETGYFNPRDTKANDSSGNTFLESEHALTKDDFESVDASELFSSRAEGGLLPDVRCFMLKAESYWADKNVGYRYERYIAQMESAKKTRGCFAE